MYQNNNHQQSGDEQFTHFSSQVQLGREIQETLKDLRMAIKMDITGTLYSLLVDNFEIVMTPYIRLDAKTKKDNYAARMQYHIMSIKSELIERTKNSKLSDQEVCQIILTDMEYKRRFAEKKHRELMNLLARFALLPIPMINDKVEAVDFETFDESLESN